MEVGTHDEAVIPLDDEYPLRELTGRIIGAFWTVYDTFEDGYLEGVYKKAIAVELAYLGIAFAREVPFELFHRGVSVGFYRADLIAESSVIIEVKVGKALDPTARRQLRNYLKASGLEVGLLLHFGPQPEIRRVVQRSSSA